MNQTGYLSNGMSNRGAWVVLIAALFTVVLYLIPFLSPIAYPFLLLSTLVHEMGHGIAAILCGGNFHSFKIWPDGSGVANISGNFGNVAKALVAGAGLIGPAIASALFFWSLRSERRCRIMLASFGILLCLSILLVVRNLFGVFFVAAIAATSFYFSLGSGKSYSRLVLAFIAVELSLSVFSRGDYLFKDQAMTAQGPMPSDVSQMAQALFLPYWFWGLICGLFSVLVLAYGIRTVFKGS